MTEGIKWVDVSDALPDNQETPCYVTRFFPSGRRFVSIVWYMGGGTWDGGDCQIYGTHELDILFWSEIVLPEPYEG